MLFHAVVSKSMNAGLRYFLLLVVLVFAGASRAGIVGGQNFIYTSSGELESADRLLHCKDIAGAQVVYNWKQLEPKEGQYDFSRIESDLAYLKALNKALFIQVQDRFFSPDARNVPTYLLTDPVYGGGLVAQTDKPGEGRAPATGWVAQQWNPHVQQRYQALLQALAAKFDGRIYGVNLPETAIDIDMKHDRTGFSCDKYFQAEMANMKFARGVFHQSLVVQYVNFWPCEWHNDRNYMGRLFEAAAQQGIGLGGPDIVPYRRGQMKNTYPFFAKYKGRLPLVAMAVQEPTLTYTNPKTAKPFTRAEFEAFGRNYLGAQIVFWSTSTPWLKAESPDRVGP